MEYFVNTVSISNPDRLKTAHEDLDQADEKLITDCISALADGTQYVQSDLSKDILYLDDISIHTIDREGNSSHDHVNQKEVVSGDAAAWFAVVKNGERVRKFEIEYEIHAGSESGSEEFIYEPIEVTVKFK